MDSSGILDTLDTSEEMYCPDKKVPNQTLRRSRRGLKQCLNSSSLQSVVSILGKKTRFTDYQIKVLNESFGNNAYPKKDDLERLSKLLGLTLWVIDKWFKNARQRAKTSQGTKAMASLPEHLDTMESSNDQDTSDEMYSSAKKVIRPKIFGMIGLTIIRNKMEDASGTLDNLDTMDSSNAQDVLKASDQMNPPTRKVPLRRVSNAQDAVKASGKTDSPTRKVSLRRVHSDAQDAVKASSKMDPPARKVSLRRVFNAQDAVKTSGKMNPPARKVPLRRVSNAQDGVKASGKMDPPTRKVPLRRVLLRRPRHSKNSGLFECFLCKEIFMSSTYLKSHMNIIHAEWKSKLNNCKICKKSFANLARHTKIYHDEKIYRA